MNVIVPASLDYLAHLTAVVQGHALSMGYKGDEVLRLILATEELVVNIIRHAYGQRKDGSISLDLDVSGERLILTLKDWGQAYKADEHEPDVTASAEEREVGGWGLFLIRKLVGDLHYQRHKDTNRWQLTAPTPKEAKLCPT